MTGGISKTQHHDKPTIPFAPTIIYIALKQSHSRHQAPGTHFFLLDNERPFANRCLVRRKRIYCHQDFEVNETDLNFLCHN